MNAARKDVELSTAAQIAVDLESKAYARGWADGVDSTREVEGGMVLAAMLVVGVVSACIGAIITALVIW